MKCHALGAVLSTKEIMQTKVNICLGFPGLQTLTPTLGLCTNCSDVASTAGMAWQTPWKMTSSDAPSKSDRDHKSDVLFWFQPPHFTST